MGLLTPDSYGQFLDELKSRIQAARVRASLAINRKRVLLNELLRHPGEQPSIGIIPCKTRDRFIAEYALRDINNPIGISEYRLAESLPEKPQGSLPTIEQVEREFGVLQEGRPSEYRKRCAFAI